MTETIQQLKEDIAVLQEKLNKLEEIEKQPKMTLENEGDFSIVSCDGNVYYRLEYPTDVIWYRKSMVGRLEPIKDIKPKNELESQWLMTDVKYQNDNEVECDEKDNPPELTPNKFLQRILDEKIDERGYVDLREPTSSEFRQKLFDGIKSVFYDPKYERIHWKMKVNMAVDVVLTHFYDIIPDREYPSNYTYDTGWNDCIDSIKEEMELEE